MIFLKKLKNAKMLPSLLTFRLYSIGLKTAFFWDFVKYKNMLFSSRIFSEIFRNVHFVYFFYHCHPDFLASRRGFCCLRSSSRV